MVSLTLSTVALLSALLPTALAQTFTACNPLNTTGCPAMPGLNGNVTFDFNKTSYNPKTWNETGGSTSGWSEAGATFTVAQRGDSPTIKSNFYIFFGVMSVVMKAAPGQGIVSSAILQSEDLDELDWEFLGGNTTHVKTNYYGKGNTTFGDRGLDVEMSNPQEQFHNYTLLWTKEQTQWILDDKVIRTLKFEDALPGGKNYPQTPMAAKIGIWSGGDTKHNGQGVVEWAGGETDFSKAPFTMTVQQVYLQDFGTGKEYNWGDTSGTWQSITTVNGTSKALVEANKPHGVKNRWSAFPKGVQIGIISGVLGFVALLALFITVCCIKQKRAGRREYAAFQAQQNKEAAELLAYKQQMAAGRFGHGNNYHV